MASLEDVARAQRVADMNANLPTYELTRLKKEHQRQIIEGETDKNVFAEWYSDTRKQTK